MESETRPKYQTTLDDEGTTFLSATESQVIELETGIRALLDVCRMSDDLAAGEGKPHDATLDTSTVDWMAGQLLDIHQKLKANYYGAVNKRMRTQVAG